MRTLLLLLLAALTAGAPNAAGSALVNTDSLAAIGDFEKSTYVRWYSDYTGSDYDFAANNLYVTPGGGSGYALPSTDNEVADGWARGSGPTANPGRNIIFAISPGTGYQGTNCQYLALKNVESGTAEVSIGRHVPVSSTKSWYPHPGDTVTFRIDHVRMSGYSDLPPGASVNYRIDVGAKPSEIMTPSSTPSSREITAVIPANLTTLLLRVRVEVFGNIGAKQPGIFVDGAHLYVKRAGAAEYEQRQIPVERVRGIRTQNVFFMESCRDIYAAARDYDTLSLSEGEFTGMPVLRFLNPSIKLYLYIDSTKAIDVRDSAGNERPHPPPITFLYAKTNHPDWLYSGGDGTDGYCDDPEDSSRYPLRVTKPDLQSYWVDRVTSVARQFGADGIWVDSLICIKEERNSDGLLINPKRDLWEVQQFMHYVYPRLRSAGLKIIQNCSAAGLDGVPHWAGDNALVYFDPFWIPNDTYPISAGYSANSPNTVADVFFKEYSFFIPQADNNYYYKEYWLDTLADMDKINQWNTAVNPDGSPKLTISKKREMHVNLLGQDLANDPAYGQDGWISFGLCSYLLAQNDWTYFGVRVEGPLLAVSLVPYPNVDFSITKKLGVSDGTHQPYNGDPYFRYRDYGPSVGGATGGLVVVNGHTDSSRTFKLSFDGTDEQGNPVTDGQEVTLKPHTGRIFLKQKGPVFVRVRTPSDSAVAGEIVTITVNYLSSDTESALGVLLRAKVPDEMAYVPGSAETSGGSYDPATSTVSWKIGTVVAGQSGRRTFKARVK